MTLPAIMALSAVGAAGLALTYMLLRSRGRWPAIPDWTWIDIRKLIALIATVAGAGVLTALAWWLLDGLLALLVRDVASPVAVTLAEGLVWGLKLLLAGVLLVILSLGLVIGPRLMRFKGPGGTEGSLGGGDDETASPTSAARAVAGAAAEKATEIEEQQQ